MKFDFYRVHFIVLVNLNGFEVKKLILILKSFDYVLRNKRDSSLSKLTNL